MRKTAGIIIIGDEILSGKVQDSNSFFMVKELRTRGVEVRRICVIPDDTHEIAREVRMFSDIFDHVFTTGGIGPTHDDVTIEGIAEAFGVKPVIDGRLRDLLDKFYSGNLTPERLKMAEVPEGAELISDEILTFPLIRFRNIFIFPGIPELLRKKFRAIENLFDEPALLLKKVYLDEYESDVAPLLNEVVRDHHDVKIGSYPFVDNRDYRLMVTFESPDQERLNSAVTHLLSRLPKERVVGVEP